MKRFTYFEFNVVINKSDRSVLIVHKKLSNSLLNGVKFRRLDKMTLNDFIKKKEKAIKDLRKYPR